MKRDFFQALTMFILLYGCTTGTLTKRIGKKLDVNYTAMLMLHTYIYWIHTDAMITDA